MKIQIDRKNFAKVLSEVTPFAPAKAAISVLKYAKFTTSGKVLTIEANDTQCAMVKEVQMNECDEDGSFLLELADLNKFIAKTKGDTVEIQIDNGTALVKHTKGTAEYPVFDAKDFPVFSMPKENLKELEIKPAILAEAINKAKGFVATDTIRPQMSAIYAYVGMGDKIGFCASDTHRLIHIWFNTELSDKDDFNWLIMPMAFNALINACKTAETVKIQISGKHVSYQLGDTLIQTVQANGAFPNFQRVIPSTWVMECAVDKFDLIDALGRVALFCDKTECVKISISRMDMTLQVNNMDYMKRSTESLVHGGCNGEIKIGVSVSNLLAALCVFDGGEILMKFTDESKPILFGKQGVDKLQVIAMPLQLIES